MLVVGFDISLFRGLDVLDGLRRFLIIIERRKQSWLHTDVKLLHFRSIHPEILPAERPDAHQFHLPFQDIDEHRKLIQPALTKQVPPMIHPVIVRELSALLQSFMLQDIGLKILRIREHRPELVYANHISVVSYPVQFHESAISGVIVPNGLAKLLSENEELPMMKAFIHDLESGSIHPAQ